MPSNSSVARPAFKSRLPQPTKIMKKSSFLKEPKGYLKKQELAKWTNSINANGGISALRVHDENQPSLRPKKFDSADIAKNVPITPRKTRNGKVYSRLSTIFANKLSKIELPKPPIAFSSPKLPVINLPKPQLSSYDSNLPVINLLKLQCASSGPKLPEINFSSPASSKPLHEVDIISLDCQPNSMMPILSTELGMVTQEEIDRTFEDIPNLEDVDIPKALISFNSTSDSINLENNEEKLGVPDEDVGKEVAEILNEVIEMVERSYNESINKPETSHFASNDLASTSETTVFEHEPSHFVSNDLASSSETTVFEPEPSHFVSNDLASSSETTVFEPEPSRFVSNDLASSSETTVFEPEPSHFVSNDLASSSETTVFEPEPSRFVSNDLASSSETTVFEPEPSHFVSNDLASSSETTVFEPEPSHFVSNDLASSSETTVFEPEPSRFVSNDLASSSETTVFEPEPSHFVSNDLASSSETTVFEPEPSRFVSNDLASSSETTVFEPELSRSASDDLASTTVPNQNEPPKKKGRPRKTPANMKSSPLKDSTPSPPKASGLATLNPQMVNKNTPSREQVNGKTFVSITWPKNHKKKQGIPQTIEIHSSLLVNPKESCLKKEKNQSWNGQKHFRWADDKDKKELATICEFTSDEKYSFRQSTRRKSYVEPS